MTSRSLWNYYRDEVNDSADENNDANNFRINYSATTRSKSLSIRRSSQDNGTCRSCCSIKIFE